MGLRVSFWFQLGREVRFFAGWELGLGGIPCTYPRPFTSSDAAPAPPLPQSSHHDVDGPARREERQVKCATRVPRDLYHRGAVRPLHYALHIGVTFAVLRLQQPQTEPGGHEAGEDPGYPGKGRSGRVSVSDGQREAHSRIVALCYARTLG